MTTEEEAKTKWCPHTRTHVANEHGMVAINVWPKEDVMPECKCVASGCMAWRWGTESDGKGYCGLAGKS